MKTLSEVCTALKNYDGKKIRIMEVCGTHTSAIFKNGIRDIISPKIELISGPGCPVCVTGESYIDKLVDFSLTDGVCVLTFGDMMKVKGSRFSLTMAKAQGGNADIFYSPFTVIEKAKSSPETLFIIAAVGFETTIPIYALLLESIIKDNIKNIRLMISVKTIIPALEFICENENGIDAFLCPGHVSVIIGSKPYEALACRFKKPFVISGFEGEHILASIYEILFQLEKKNFQMKNLYKSVVNYSGNQNALDIIHKYFEPKDEYWRGIGIIKGSGLKLKNEYSFFDAGSDIAENIPQNSHGCSCTDIILGRKKPTECPLFAKTCTPGNAIGPCMISSEGACGIWYHNLNKGMK